MRGSHLVSSPFQPWRQRMSRTRGISDITFADQSLADVPVDEIHKRECDRGHLIVIVHGSHGNNTMIGFWRELHRANTITYTMNALWNNTSYMTIVFQGIELTSVVFSKTTFQVSTRTVSNQLKDKETL